MNLRFFIVLLLALMAGNSLFSAAPHPDGDSLVAVGNISILGNHKTKDYIILREFTFRPGDTLSLNALNHGLAETVKNLQRQPLFHFVETEITLHPANTADIEVRVQERWYTWLWPIIDFSDRNFNAWLAAKDLSRLSYGLFLQQENFRGRLEKLHIMAVAGYQQQLYALYEAPYLNKSKTLGTGLMITTARERETAFRTYKNRQEYFRHTGFLRHYTEASLFLKYRPGVHFTHTLAFEAGFFRFSDTLLALNPDYAATSDSKAFIPVIAYFFKADFRDQRAYPLSGWYADALLEWNGIVPASGFNYLTLRSSARKHLPLRGRWYLALGAEAKFSAKGLKPWFRNQGLGYNRDYVRGYEYQVIDGDHFWVAKTNLRYAVLPLRILRMGFIRAEQFNTIPVSAYLGVFADTGKAWGGYNISNTNTLHGRQLYGAGLGLDVVTYYDKVLRIETSMNREGKTGLFIHFMAAI